MPSSPEEFISDLSADVRPLVAELRRLIFDTVPHATESIRWDAISYHDADQGGPIQGGICQIVVRDGVVRLDFVHGASLPDPHELLHEEKGRKAKRFATFEPGKKLPAQALRELIKAADAYDFADR